MEKEELKKIFVSSLGAIAPEARLETLDPDEPIRDQIDIDSVDFLNLVVRLCEILKINIPESDYSKLTTLNDCINYLSEKS